MDTTFSPAPEKRKTENRRPFIVCFVCTGNTCRSPMAAAVFNHLVATGHKPRLLSAADAADASDIGDIRGESAGLYALGEPISAPAVAALEAAGIPSTPDNNYASHTAVGVDEFTMATCDLVVGISGAHALGLLSSFPGYASKITCMPHDIPDPFGGTEDDYKACLAEIEKGVKELFFPFGERA